MTLEFEKIEKLTAVEIGERINSLDIDPRELTASYFDKIKERDTDFQIYARLTETRAESAAQTAYERAKTGLRRHVLDGVPISWKDLFDTADVKTEAGSKLLKDRQPKSDAKVLQTSEKNGLICLGKTHMSELAFSGLGVNPSTATSPNPYHTDWAPGGSSSGAASSVSHGIAAAAIGSDTGGSVRGPAAWQGLVGLKTTSGLISLDGVVPLSPSLDTVGPLCKSVGDCAALLSAMTDTKSLDLNGTDIKGKRFLLATNIIYDHAEPEVIQSFELAVEKIKSAGAEVIYQDVSEFAEVYALEGASTLVSAEGYAIYKDQIEARPDDLYGPICERFKIGGSMDASILAAARFGLKRLTDSFSRKLSGFDGAIMPTCPITPPSVTKLLEDQDYYAKTNLLALRNTRLGNMLGNCGITLPIDKTAKGAPVGFMVLGQPYEEARLLRVARSLEAIL